jgi:hypothetical protein
MITKRRLRLLLKELRKHFKAVDIPDHSDPPLGREYIEWAVKHNARCEAIEEVCSLLEWQFKLNRNHK